MKKLVANILLFTAGLTLMTLTIEVYRKGKLQIDEPWLFAGAIVALGIIGGYTITWVAEGKNR